MNLFIVLAAANIILRYAFAKKMVYACIAANKKLKLKLGGKHE